MRMIQLHAEALGYLGEVLSHHKGVCDKLEVWSASYHPSSESFSQLELLNQFRGFGFRLQDLADLEGCGDFSMLMLKKEGAFPPLPHLLLPAMKEVGISQCQSDILRVLESSHAQKKLFII